MNELSRCPRCLSHPDYIRYHDEERGVPLHDENKHFEMLMLETMQAGLSRWTILQRRENYRQAFANFDPKQIIKFDNINIEELMLNEGIIRNRAKIVSTISNAQAFLDIQSEFGSFDVYIWGFTDREVINNQLHNMEDYRPTSELSDMIAKDLKRRGFKFIGSTTVYARLQAIGIINDHLTSCYRYKQLQ